MAGVDTIDAYFTIIRADQAAALQDLRVRINALLPGNTEVISYAMPGHKYRGKMIAGYAGFAKHLGLYPHSGGVIPGFADELAALPEDLAGRIRTLENSAATLLTDAAARIEMLSRRVDEAS